MGTRRKKYTRDERPPHPVVATVEKYLGPYLFEGYLCVPAEMKTFLFVTTVAQNERYMQ